MTRFIAPFVTAALLSCTSATHAIESLAFDVVESANDIEIRRYAPHMLATVRVAADFDEAGSEGFVRCLTSSAVTMPARKKSR